MTPEQALVAAARGHAVGEHLSNLAFEFVPDLDVPAVIDPDSHTMWIRKGTSLEDAIFLVLAGLDAMCGGRSIVEAGDGDGTAWSPGIAVGAESDPPPPTGRPNLRLV